MTAKHLFAILACAFSAHAAQADVMYSWHETQSSPNMLSDIRVELVFSDAAVAAGTLMLGINNLCRDPGCIDPQTSLLSLRYSVESAGGSRNIIDYRANSAPNIFEDRIWLALDFLPGGFLSGEIRAGNGESNFHMSSEGPTFTLLGAYSDQGPCGMGLDCYGTQGLLKQAVPAQVPANVPEPASWLVFGAGLLAAISARAARLRSKRK